MTTSEPFHFFDLLGHHRSIEAVMDTVDGMASSEGLYLLNAVRALDSLKEALAANPTNAASADLEDIVEELISHVAGVALAIHERED